MIDTLVLCGSRKIATVFLRSPFKPKVIQVFSKEHGFLNDLADEELSVWTGRNPYWAWIFKAIDDVSGLFLRKAVPFNPRVVVFVDERSSEAADYSAILYWIKRNKSIGRRFRSPGVVCVLVSNDSEAALDEQVYLSGFDHVLSQQDCRNDSHVARLIHGAIAGAKSRWSEKGKYLSDALWAFVIAFAVIPVVTGFALELGRASAVVVWKVLCGAKQGQAEASE